MTPIPVIVICGEAGSGKSTVSNALVETYGFALVDGDLVHHYPPWNNFSIMEELCCRFIQEEVFMQNTVDIIVKDIETKLRSYDDCETPSPVGIVMPFVMYTRSSREYMAYCLSHLSSTLSSFVPTIKFIWLTLDQSIHRERGTARVDKWSAIGIQMHPNDVVDMTTRLCIGDNKDDCLMIENSTLDQLDDTVRAIHELALHCIKTTTTTVNTYNYTTTMESPPPSQKLHRNTSSFFNRSPWIILLICSLTFGVYYAYDVPAALPDQFKKLSGGHTTSYELLYTVYSIPSMVSPLFIGILADSSYGPHFCTIVASLLVTIACVVIAFGCSLNSFELVLCGRFLMGMGGEAIYALQQTLSTWWIKEDLQPLAMSLAIASGAVGEILNFIFTPQIYNSFHFSGTQWWVAAISCISVLGALMLQFLSRGLEHYDIGGNAFDNFIQPTDITNQSSSGNSNLIHEEEQNEKSLRYRPLKGEEKDPENGDDASASWKQMVRIETVLLYSINLLTMSAYYILPSIVKQFLHETHHQEHVNTSLSANSLNILLYLIPLIISPVLGWMVGSRKLLVLIYILSFGCLNAALGFILFSFHQHLFLSPLYAIAILGFGCSIITSTLTPCIAITVPDTLHGSAFGLWSCIQSAGIALYSVVIGELSDIYTTQAAVLFLGCCAALATLLCVVLILYIPYVHLHNTTATTTPVSHTHIHVEEKGGGGDVRDGGVGEAITSPLIN